MKSALNSDLPAEDRQNLDLGQSQLPSSRPSSLLKGISAAGTRVLHLFLACEGNWSDGFPKKKNMEASQSSIKSKVKKPVRRLVCRPTVDRSAKVSSATEVNCLCVQAVQSGGKIKPPTQPPAELARRAGRAPWCWGLIVAEVISSNC